MFHLFYTRDKLPFILSTYTNYWKWFNLFKFRKISLLPENKSQKHGSVASIIKLSSGYRKSILSKWICVTDSFATIQETEFESGINGYHAKAICGIENSSPQIANATQTGVHLNTAVHNILHVVREIDIRSW